jgi:hypothetical protein
MGETLRTGNSVDYRIHDPGGSRFCGRGEVDEGTEGVIERSLFFVQLTLVDVRNLTREVQLYRLLKASTFGAIFQ